MRHQISLSSVIFYTLILNALLMSGCGRQLVEPTPDAGPPAQGFCENTAECDPFFTCVAGVCVADQVDPNAECQNTNQCAGTNVCVDGDCVAPPAECSTGEDCPGDLLCDGFSRTCFDPDESGCENDADCTLEPQCAQTGCTCEASGDCVANPDGPPPPSGASANLDGYTLQNLEQPTQQTVRFDSSFVLEPGEILIIGRNASRSAFEQAWQTTLSDNVLYFNNDSASRGIPVINGEEEWVLIAPSGNIVDESIEGRNTRSYQRTQQNGTVDWQEGTINDATPGTVALPTTGVGLVISEWSDADEFAFEFIELYYAP